MHIPTKIPTIIGIILTILIVGILSVTTEYYVQTTTVASGSILPANVQITNISDTTFTVSWTTQLPATGALSVVTPKGTQILFDDQDTKNQGTYTTHNVTYRAAIPETEYSVTILSNNKKSVNGTTPYTVHTGPVLTTTSGNLEPAYGTIVSSDNQPVRGALVYLSLEGGQMLSTISKPSGTWLIPLNLVRTQDMTSFLPTTDRMDETIVVQTNGTTIHAVTDTLNDSPVPNMIPGGTNDFRKLNAKTPGLPLALLPTQQIQKSPGAVLGIGVAKSANIVSLTIPAEGSAIPTTLPLIQGTGIPGKIVSLVLGITNPMGDITTVATNGLWSYTPKKPLTPGKQSVTITTNNLQNQPIAITHMFEILKSGTQVLGVATPSATLTPTATPIVTLTPTPTIELVASPSAIPESTLAAQPVPTSGNELPTILLLLISIGLILVGGLTFI